MAEIIFPEKMENIAGLSEEEKLKIHDDYIRYIVERVDFAFNGYTSKKKFITAIEDIIEDSGIPAEVESEKHARELAVEELNDKLSTSSGLYTTTDPSTGIIYLHNKKEDDGVLPPYTNSTTVLKITNSAIGISNDGGATYPYGLSLDDGNAILNKIYAIGIDASHITTGTLSDASGKYSLNMSTGAVNMSSANITGGSINIETSDQNADKIKLVAKVQVLSNLYKYSTTLTPVNLTARIDYDSSTYSQSTLGASGLTVQQTSASNSARCNTFNIGYFDRSKGYMQSGLISTGQATSGSGSAGYIHIGTIDIMSTYANVPIRFSVAGRGYHVECFLFISSAGTIGGAGINTFSYSGVGDPVIIAVLGNESTGTTTTTNGSTTTTSTYTYKPINIYVKKSEGYDSAQVLDYYTNCYESSRVRFSPVCAFYSSIPLTGTQVQAFRSDITHGGDYLDGYVRIARGNIQIAWKRINASGSGITFSAWGNIFESTAIGMGNWKAAFAAYPACAFSAMTSGATDVWVATNSVRSGTSIGNIFLERATTANVSAQTVYVTAIGVGVYS